MLDDPLRRLIRRLWRDATLPLDAVGIPTMLSKAERRLLYSLARDYATGDGAVVDAGCFLGGSTAALLAGVRDRPEPWTGPPVESYDLFRVEEFTIPKFFRDEAVRVGESFRPRFEAHVGRITPEACRANAARFTHARFRDEFVAAVDEQYARFARSAAR